MGEVWLSLIIFLGLLMLAVAAGGVAALLAGAVGWSGPP
jgi:hypothetical protein